MKMTTRLFLTAISMVGTASASYAQTETASATATAIIVTPLSITKDVDMHFGIVAVNATASGSVVLTPAGVPGAVDGAWIPTLAGSATAAAFTVNGQDNYTYTITLPSTDVVLDDGLLHTMTVNTFTCDPLVAEGALTDGVQVIHVGATLNIGAGQVPGTYSSDTPFNVTVNYN